MCVADSTDGVYGVGSSLAVRRVSTNVNIPPVKLRPPRTHYLSRPVSLPVDRLLNERNDCNMAERENLGGAIAERPEAKKVESHTYRSPFVHTHTLRRTWDKQYRHYDVTPRTAMIVANLPPSGAVGEAKTKNPKTDTAKPDGSKPVPAEGQCSFLSQNSPYTATVRPLQTLGCDSSRSAKDVPIAFRAPRTLQPPPGTFYRPPHSHVKTPNMERNAPLATLNVCPSCPSTLTSPSTGSDMFSKEEVQSESKSDDVRENNSGRERDFV